MRRRARGRRLGWPWRRRRMPLSCVPRNLRRATSSLLACVALRATELGRARRRRGSPCPRAQGNALRHTARATQTMASRSPLSAVSDANVPTEMDVEPSKLVQRVRGYEILSKLGDGAYGTVYTARDFNGSIVALKLIEYPPKDTDMVPAALATGVSYTPPRMRGQAAHEASIFSNWPPRRTTRRWCASTSSFRARLCGAGAGLVDGVCFPTT